MTGPGTETGPVFERDRPRDDRRDHRDPPNETETPCLTPILAVSPESRRCLDQKEMITTATARPPLAARFAE